MQRTTLSIRLKPSLKEFLMKYSKSQDISTSRLLENMSQLLKNAVEKEDDTPC